MSQVLVKQVKPRKLQFVEILRLQNQNYLLTQQLEDLKNKYNNLKKQHQIWEHINTNNSNNVEVQKQLIIKSYEKEVDCLKQQIISIANERQQLQIILKEKTQKIQDLKYNNSQLKQLNEKQTQLHQKQIQLLFSNNHSKSQQYCGYFLNSLVHNDNSYRLNQKNQQYKQFQKNIDECELKISLLQKELQFQKQINEKNKEKLQKCSEITKQMQEYYISQLQSKELTIEQQENQIKRLSMNFDNICIQTPKQKIYDRYTSESQNSLKCSSIVSQYHVNNSKQRLTNMNIYQLQQQYQYNIHQIKQVYEQKIAKYQDKIKYLILKIQSLESQKQYQNYDKLSYPCQSLKLSKTSNDSSLNKFTPNTSLSIMKQNYIYSGQNNIANRTPTKLSLKSHKTNRNSCHYQRAPLNEIHNHR